MKGEWLVVVIRRLTEEILKKVIVVEKILPR